MHQLAGGRIKKPATGSLGYLPSPMLGDSSGSNMAHYNVTGLSQLTPIDAHPNSHVKGHKDAYWCNHSTSTTDMD